MQKSALIIYIHGFLSSSRSEKACILEKYLETVDPSEFGFKEISFLSPNLPFSPKKTEETLEQLIKQAKPDVVGLLGSSMGGFYANVMAQKLRLKAVLINPVVGPLDLLGQYLGQEMQNPYTEERHTFTQVDMEKLDEMDQGLTEKEQLLKVLLEEGDETLDYRLAEKKYKLCDLKIFPNGNHRFQNFEQCIPEILKFILDGKLER